GDRALLVQSKADRRSALPIHPAHRPSRESSTLPIDSCSRGICADSTGYLRSDRPTAQRGLETGHPHLAARERRISFDRAVSVGGADLRGSLIQTIAGKPVSPAKKRKSSVDSVASTIIGT